MRELFEKLKKHLEQGEAAVLVTVIASSGSTPRGAGSRMLVDKDGLVCGTIGGGAVEYKAMGIAKEALEKKSSYTHGFTLTRNQVADIGMVCGGDVTVYFQYVDPEDRTFRAFLEQILEALSRDEDSWLLLDITDETCWKMGLYRRGEALGMDLPEEMDKSFGVKALQREAGGRKYYVEPLVQAGHGVRVRRGAMWPRSWFRFWPMWAFGAWSWMTGRSLPIPRYFPRQSARWWGIWSGSPTMCRSQSGTMCAS